MAYYHDKVHHWNFEEWYVTTGHVDQYQIYWMPYKNMGMQTGIKAKFKVPHEMDGMKTTSFCNVKTSVFDWT